MAKKVKRKSSSSNSSPRTSSSSHRDLSPVMQVGVVFVVVAAMLLMWYVGTLGS